MPKLKTALIGVCLTALVSSCAHDEVVSPTPEQVEISTRNNVVVEVDGLTFRDLNKNNQLDAYEDWRLTSLERAQDLVDRMTLPEKAGQIAHGNIMPEGEYGAPPTGYNMFLFDLAHQQHITAYIPFLSLDFLGFAEQNNLIQEKAEASRLGIPLTISTDPRHHFVAMVGAGASGEGFSQWPEPLGFAALNDADLMFEFASIAASEYRAVGFNQALSPQADLGTEPRWPRIYATFGEDPEIAKRLTNAYIRGFQGGDQGLARGGVSTVVKHWVGYGAAKDGFDSHNYYGRFADLNEADFADHVKPFEGAFEAGVSGVMPAYSVFDGLVVDGQPVEAVGAGYSKVLIKDLLRGDYEFDGVVLSDWMITATCNEACRNGAAPGEQPNPMTDLSTGWGVQDLTEAERFALGMEAGIDQFGGVLDTAPIIEAVESGLISDARLNRSVVRVLKKTFDTGLFEDPFVDVTAAKKIVNQSATQDLALETQARAMVMLKHGESKAPLAETSQKLFLHNAEADVFMTAGFELVSDLTEADIAVVRLSSPYETLHPGYFFGGKQYEGSLEFPKDGDALTVLAALKAAGVNTIVDVSLDRPAILTNVEPFAETLVVNFGASDKALLRVLEGAIPAEGRLPYELPRSMAAVEAQASGKPADSADPLYPLKFAAE